MTEHTYSIPNFEELKDMNLEDLSDRLDPSRQYDVTFRFVGLDSEPFSPKWSEKGEGFLQSPVEVGWCILNGSRLGASMMMDLHDIVITDEGPVADAA